MMRRMLSTLRWLPLFVLFVVYRTSSQRLPFFSALLVRSGQPLGRGRRACLAVSPCSETLCIPKNNVC